MTRKARLEWEIMCSETFPSNLAFLENILNAGNHAWRTLALCLRPPIATVLLSN